MKIFIFSIYIVISLNIFSQTTMWTRVYGTSGDDWNNGGFDKTFDGGYITANISSTYNLMKVDSIGLIQWYKSSSNFGVGILRIKQTFDSGYIGLGQNLNNLIVLKLNNIGDSTWQRFFTTNSRASQIIITKDGKFIILGIRFYQNLASEAYVAKINTNGDLIWENTFRDSINTGADDIIQAEDGNIYFTGSTWNNYANPDTSYYYLSKIDSNGQLCWFKTYLSNQYREMRGKRLIQNNNNIYISGTKDSLIFSQDLMFFSKIDTSGNRIWEKSYLPSSGNDDMCITKNGLFVLTGYVLSQNIPILKLDSEGNIISYKEIDVFGEETDEGTSIKNTGDNGFIIFGNTTYGQSDLPFANIFGIKTDSNGNALPVGIKISESLVNDFYIENIYPNPFNGKCRVRINSDKIKNITINIFDVLGRNIVTKTKYLNIGINELLIDSEEHELSSGIYFLVINDTKLKLTNKLILIK